MRRVLIIDDDPGTLETFGAILRLAGHQPTLAATGTQGLALARETRPDLMLTDLRLPDMSGIDVINRFVVDRVRCPCVMMTGFPSTETALEAGKLGVAAYVAKPIFDDALLAIVDAHASCSNISDSIGDEIIPRDNPHVSRALTAIEWRHGEPDLSVGSFARGINVSVEHLCRLMKRHTGNSFRVLLVRTRVREARRLLETTTLSIKEISARVGFGDTSQCDRHFRIVCGQSPRAYQNSVRHAPDSNTSVGAGGAAGWMS